MNIIINSTNLKIEKVYIELPHIEQNWDCIAKNFFKVELEAIFQHNL